MEIAKKSCRFPIQSTLMPLNNSIISSYLVLDTKRRWLFRVCKGQMLMLSPTSLRASTISKRVRETKTAVNILETRPMTRVTANPLTGPVPNKNKNVADISAARWVSTRVINTRLKLVNTAVYRDYSENRARYSEKVEIPEINLTLLAHYEMEALGEASTRLNFNVNWMGATLPAEKKQGMMAGQAANFELFKHVCETNPA